MVKGEKAPLTFVAWRSGKLPRKARSSLAAEVQALSETDQELMYCPLQWSKFCGYAVDFRNVSKAVSRVPGTLVIDEKALYNVLGSCQRPSLTGSACHEHVHPC